MHFGHSRIEISGSHGVANRFALLSNRQVLLRIGSRHYTFTLRFVGNSPDIQKLFGHVQIKRVSGYPEKFNQPELNFFVARCLVYRFSVVVIFIAFKKNLIYVPCIFFGYIHPFSFPGCLIISYCCFVHVAHVIQFVTVQYKRVRFIAHSGASPGVVPVFYTNGVGHVQVTIFFLCIANNLNDAVHFGLDAFILLQHEDVSRAFHYFIQIG